MTISSYAELKTAIQNWFMDRADLAVFADEFIDLAEAYLNLNLRCREMEAVTSLTPVANVCTLPADYIEQKRVVEKAATRRPLEFITEDVVDSYYPVRAGGPAQHFTIIGQTLTAYPLSASDIELTYYQALPALSGANPSNWLIAKLPNLYLHTCLMYAAEFAKDNDELARETAFVSQFMDMLAGANDRAKFGNAGMSLRGPTP